MSGGSTCSLDTLGHCVGEGKGESLRQSNLASRPRVTRPDVVKHHVVTGPLYLPRSPVRQSRSQERGGLLDVNMSSLDNLVTVMTASAHSVFLRTAIVSMRQRGSIFILVPSI
jgi:hypothetical protein